MTKFYVSYRTADFRKSSMTMRLVEFLKEQLGDDYFQVGNNSVDDWYRSPGVDVASNLQFAIQSCDVLLAIIGPDWLNDTDRDGQPRIYQEYDFVRIEIATALALRKKVLPILLDDTPIPRSSVLPKELVGLAARQAAHILEDPFFEENATRLVKVLKNSFSSGGTLLSDNRPRSVFISYSHRDDMWKDVLVRDLAVLEKQGRLNLWEDTKIKPGDEWQIEIIQAMENASIAILLISNEFLASDFSRSVEVPKLLDRQKREGLRIIPLIVRPCAWRRYPWLRNLKVYPEGGKPLFDQPLSQVRPDRTDLGRADLTDLINEIAVLTS